MERIDHIFTTSAPIEKVWDYFINPASLEELEPPHHHLEMISENLPPEAYIGLKVKYSIAPLNGVHFNIENVFTEIEPITFYATEIINGVFDYWRYEHIFRTLPSGGTEIKNVIFFKPMVGDLAKKIDMAFIKKEINAIFKHRSGIVKEKWDR